jgi:hypothetical protein
MYVPVPVLLAMDYVRMQFLLRFQSRTRVNLLCFRSRARDANPPGQVITARAVVGQPTLHSLATLPEAVVAQQQRSCPAPRARAWLLPLPT